MNNPVVSVPISILSLGYAFLTASMSYVTYA